LQAGKHGPLTVAAGMTRPFYQLLTEGKYYETSYIYQLLVLNGEKEFGRIVAGTDMNEIKKLMDAGVAKAQSI